MKVFLALAIASPVWCFLPPSIQHRSVLRVADGDYPSDSDYGADDSNAIQDAYVVQSLETIKESLLALAAFTARGEAASLEEKVMGRNLVRDLEDMNPTESPARSAQGTWELVWSDTQLFRSSPFFMAGRAVCTEEQAKQYDWFCDMHRAALAMSNIRRVRQIVSATQVVSEFEVAAGAIPFLGSLPFLNDYGGGLPVAVTGAIVSTADIQATTDDGAGWELLMDTVEIKGSNVPLLRTALGAGLKLESRSLGSVLESTFPDQYTNPKPVFTTTYLDKQLRVSRDQDGKMFVYSKVSSSTEPSDFSDIAADLGLGAFVVAAQELFTSP
eukprot:CAMPEP_0171948124 /NCGR_PEP_ID=MMETSP0993-20121228/64356_1 /TAXON_ID=483369 /ORGANISM="non described non described, Strain CCMP2098" /LENGTH=327 /DNA_ID=CAMNT_0012592113 /DNA_START=21 /DNA_END=1004 /DNA_ORIENTATION=-